jgi:hypothetical protein
LPRPPASSAAETASTTSEARCFVRRSSRAGPDRMLKEATSK